MEISNWILSLETGAKKPKGQQQVVRLTNGGVGVIRKSAGNEMLGNLDTLEDLLPLVCYCLFWYFVSATPLLLHTLPAYIAM